MSPTVAGPPVTIPAAWLAEDASDEQCAALADLTAQAYSGSDPRPGLPPPDGAGERPASVRARLDTGERYVVVPGPDGRMQGAAGVRTRADRSMYLARIVTAPQARGGGVLAAILAAAGAEADRTGLRGLALDAVVERCLPTVYVRHGFVPVRWWRADDKPLCEITLERPGVDTGPATPAVCAEPGTVVVWTVDGPATVTPRLLGDVPSGTPVAGVDVRSTGSITRDPAPVADTDPRFLMPRGDDPGAMSVWRTAPGRARQLSELLPLVSVPTVPHGDHRGREVP